MVGYSDNEWKKSLGVKFIYSKRSEGLIKFRLNYRDTVLYKSHLHRKLP